MMITTPMDRMRARGVANYIQMIQEHLEAMQRDTHGLEYAPWKEEVDDLWKRTFTKISGMSLSAQKPTLESLRDLWTSYVTHYGILN